MLCKRCMAVMKSGTLYEQKNDNKKGYRRYDECPKCHDKVLVLVNICVGIAL